MTIPLPSYPIIPTHILLAPMERNSGPPPILEGPTLGNMLHRHTSPTNGRLAPVRKAEESSGARIVKIVELRPDCPCSAIFMVVL